MTDPSNDGTSDLKHPEKLEETSVTVISRSDSVERKDVSDGVTNKRKLGAIESLPFTYDSKTECEPKVIVRRSPRKSVERNKSLYKDENSNLLNEDLVEEERVIVLRAESEEFVDKIAKELANFVMDDRKVKEKKRSNSFRRIFSGGFFGGKDKKKKDEAKQKAVKTGDSNGCKDNLQNETNVFNRNTPIRHTVSGNDYQNHRPVMTEAHVKELEKQYAEMHINKFNQIRDNFNHQNNNGHVPMDTNAKKKPSISDYISMPVQKYIDTSTSTSTSELDKTNAYENSVEVQNEIRRNQANTNNFDTNERKSRFPDNYRQTPPRAQETYQDFKLIKPKASIPINSERALPNPYQNECDGMQTPRTIEINLNKCDVKDYPTKQNLTPNQPYFDDTYGTVYDSLEQTNNGAQKSVGDPLSTTSKSPSLEGHKLKLPTNREIIDLQPRGKSPIPSNKVSTEKIIATELLKNSRSPTPSHKNRMMETDGFKTTDRIINKPPISPKSPDRITTNVVVHNPSPTRRPQTPNEVEMRNRSMSPTNLRSSTPDVRMFPSVKTSPQKEDIRKSVEAYYWKELKKMKEKEDYELYMMQLTNNGYLEDPVRVRRSRSLSPSVQRVGRRSMSLPRDGRMAPVENPYGRRFLPPPQAIPEGRALINVPQVIRVPYQPPPTFIRNVPQRQTIGSLRENRLDSTSTDSMQRPIFKRGSLNKEKVVEVQVNANKKVSFSNTGNPQSSWPTRNGYTLNPPQRRQRDSLLEDDVFLPDASNLDAVYTGPVLQQTNPLYYQTMSKLPRTYSQIVEPQYGHRKLDTRKLSYESLNLPRHENLYQNQETLREVPLRREIIITDNIYGQFGGYYEHHPLYFKKDNNEQVYSSKLSIADSNYNPKRVTVTNKVCDIYGQIHDSPSVQKSGVLYGQLQQPTTDTVASRNNFMRGTRLTASANDMGKRYVIDGRHQQSAPLRPLPPTPTKKRPPQPFLVSAESSPNITDSPRMAVQNKPQTKRRGLFDEEWNSDGKSGRGTSGNDSGRSDNEGGEVRSRSRTARRDDPRRHTLGADQQYLGMAGQGGPLSRTMDLEGQPRGYPPPSNAMLFDDDPGIMSEVETSSTGFRRGGKQRSSLPVVRTPSKTLERPLGLVFLQYRNETKRALLPNEITSIDTVKALFVRSFPKQLTMEYLDSPNVKIYIHDSSKDMFYELEDLRSHLREIRDRSVLRLFESADVSGGLPMAGIGIAGGVGHFEDPSYFSEPEFDSEYQHQHIHKSKGSAGKAPYYMGSTASLPRGAALLRTYSPAVGNLPADRLKSLPTGAPPKPQRAYSSGSTRSGDGPPRPPDRFVPFQRPAKPLFNVPDGYMSSPERSSRYEDPYYNQYTSRSGSITPVIDEEISYFSDTELLDDSYSLYGVKLPPGGPRAPPRSPFPPPNAVPYDATRLRVENMERQLANLTGLVQKALTQTPTTHLQVPGRENFRSGDEFDKNSSSSSASLPDDSYLRTDSKAPKLGKSGCHKSVSFEKSVSFSDEPPDMNSPKQHSPQHAADTKPTKPAIKSSTLPRTSSQERDRLKPAPPPKPASLSPGQYDGRLLYRDLQLTPEMYNQLRGLQKKAKDLRAEVRNLRRMSQAQAHSVRETIRDTFIKIRAMLLAGGEQVWQAGMDQERVRLNREEDLYKQEMLRLEKDLSDLESTVEELRGNVINRKTRVNMSDVENMALVLSKSSKTVADLKLRFPGLQDGMKTFLSSEMEKVMREEKFLKEEPERLESALRRCKKLTGTLVTLKRLASVQEQRLPCSNSTNDGRLSPTATETPPITPTSSQHSKSSAGARVGSVVVGGDGTNASDGGQRPENALDALLDELQTFSKPHGPQDQAPPPAVPAKGIAPHPPHVSEIGRKGSMDSATFLPTQNLTVSTTTGSLRRLHSYPSGSDTDNSPPIQPLQKEMARAGKPPIPERNAELLQHVRRVPPPPPPRTSSKSPLASPTSPGLPPKSPAAVLQHIQNVQNMSQFEAATQNLGLGTLRRNRGGSVKDKAQTLPRTIGSNLAPAIADNEGISASNSSSCESVNSQDGTKKTRKEELEQRHQELLKKQKALQEQYARLQQLQRGNNTLAVVPPAPDQLLKKTGSESNLLQKMGLQMSTSQMTGSLTNLPNSAHKEKAANGAQNDSSTSSNEEQTNSAGKVYETDIL